MYDDPLDWWRRVAIRTAITFCIILTYITLAGVVLWAIVQGVGYLNNKILHWGEIGLVFWTVLLILGFISLLISLSEIDNGL